MLKVKKDDQVFVLGQGAGLVTRVGPDGSFVVSVPGRGETHYTANGTIGASQTRRIYYHDPVIVDPCQDPDLWETFTRLARSLFKELEGLKAKGKC